MLKPHCGFKARQVAVIAGIRASVLDAAGSRRLSIQPLTRTREPHLQRMEAELRQASLRPRGPACSVGRASTPGHLAQRDQERSRQALFLKRPPALGRMIFVVGTWTHRMFLQRKLFIWRGPPPPVERPADLGDKHPIRVITPEEQLSALCSLSVPFGDRRGLLVFSVFPRQKARSGDPTPPDV